MLVITRSMTRVVGLVVVVGDGDEDGLEGLDGEEGGIEDETRGLVEVSD